MILLQFKLLRQALCENSLGPALAASSLPATSASLLLAEMWRGGRRAQSYLQSWQQWCSKRWLGPPSLPPPALPRCAQEGHARLLCLAPSPLRLRSGSAARG